jgi:hypothetical protein
MVIDDDDDDNSNNEIKIFYPVYSLYTSSFYFLAEGTKFLFLCAGQ